MVAVTQTIPNYIGGVSSQPDEKKSPGQVKDIINGYPDPSFGLSKRNGSQFLNILYEVSGEDQLESASWFFVNRTAAEAYFGCVTKAGDLRIWNAITQQKVTNITYEGNSKDYLTLINDGNSFFPPVPHGNFKFTTVQDVTYFTNKTVKVEEQSKSTYKLKERATIILRVIENNAKYSVFINGTEFSYTSPDFPDISDGEPATTAEDILQGIISILPAFVTGTIYSNALELTTTEAFSIDVKAGSTGIALDCYQDEVGNAGRLSATSPDGRRVKVINTINENDSYFLKFKANAQQQVTGAGTGYWVEDLGWDEIDGQVYLASSGLKDETMPHVLINTEPNTFVFKEVQYTDRLVGNDVSNPAPSFVGRTISESFIHSNRLGFLSSDNVIMSAAKDFSNFYFKSAQTIIASDPIDVNCSSIRPADLFAVVPQAQGLVLFSRFEQFLLFSDAAVLTPRDTIVRSISNYEVDQNVDPVDVGTIIMFLSKTPSFTKTMAMQTRGNQDDPIVVDIGKLASEYVPSSIGQLISSPQNSFIALTDQSIKDIYFYKFFNNGKEDLMQAWFRWTLPGTIQTFNVAQDQFFIVTKQNGQYILSGIGLAQAPDKGLLSPQMSVNPRIELYFRADPSSITYNAEEDISSFPVPYRNISGYEPVVMTVPTMTRTIATSLLKIPFRIEPDNTSESGYLIPVIREDLGTWVLQGDWRGQENNLIGGYYYDFEIELPTTYFRVQDGASDYTAQLVLSRYVFSMGLTGSVSFESKAFGSNTWEPLMPIIPANYYEADKAPYISDTLITVPIYQKNEYFDFKVSANTPFPVTLNSMKWEGQYSPRFYRRT